MGFSIRSQRVGNVGFDECCHWVPLIWIQRIEARETIDLIDQAMAPAVCRGGELARSRAQPRWTQRRARSRQVAGIRGYTKCMSRPRRRLGAARRRGYRASPCSNLRAQLYQIAAIAAVHHKSDARIALTAIPRQPWTTDAVYERESTLRRTGDRRVSLFPPGKTQLFMMFR